MVHAAYSASYWHRVSLATARQWQPACTAQGLAAKAARKFKATTHSKHNLPVFDNLLNQDFSATAPNQKWVGDITYLGTDEGRLYLAVIIDLFSRQVIGWTMSECMTADLVCDALQMAVFKHKRPKGVVVHSATGAANIAPMPTASCWKNTSCKVT